MERRYPCEETTLDMWAGPLRVRLWVSNHWAGRPGTEVLEQAQGALMTMPRAGPVEACEWLARFGAIEGLAAVQVIDAEGLGHMIYTEPFDV